VLEQKLSLTVKPSRIWTSAVMLIAVCAASTVWSWSALQVLWPQAWRLALAALGFVALGLGLSLAWQRIVVLRWDGQVWHSSHAAGAEECFNPGFLTVHVDLGSWMLVCWQPHQVEANRIKAPWMRSVAGQWLAIERRGLQGDWHALRCAVFGRVV
jgi:hypothetical protein